MAADPDKKVIFDSVEVLSRAKSQAEGRVKYARLLMADGEIEGAELTDIQRLYDLARADVNAGIDRLLVELETTGSYESTEAYSRFAERAAERVAGFIRESDAITRADKRSGLAAAAGVNFAKELVTAFVDVWKTLRGERTERHSLLTQRIASLKWSEFDEI